MLWRAVLIAFAKAEQPGNDALFLSRPPALADAYSQPFSGDGLEAAALQSSRQWNADSLPNPRVDPDACGMTFSSMRRDLCDPEARLCNKNTSTGLCDLEVGRDKVLHALAAVDEAPTHRDCGPFQGCICCIPGALPSGDLSTLRCRP